MDKQIFHYMNFLYFCLILQEIPPHLATSPMPLSEDMMEKGVMDMKKKYLGEKRKKIKRNREKIEESSSHTEQVKRREYRND